MVKFVSFIIFKIRGWKFINTLPRELQSFVLIGAPHTSNQDFIPAMTMAYMLKQKSHFVIKNEWLKIPLIGWILKSMGAIGLDRKKIQENGPSHSTDLMANFFQQEKNFVLFISPEGTRKANPNWKTGFYYIAQKAHVPIVLGYADYKNKVAGLGTYFYPKNFKEDMDKISQYYSTISAKVPENFCLPIIK